MTRRPRGQGILGGRDWAPLTELIATFSGPDQSARLSPGGYHAIFVTTPEQVDEAVVAVAALV